MVTINSTGSDHRCSVCLPVLFTVNRQTGARQDGAAARGEPRPVADVRDDVAGGHGVARAALAWGSAASSFQKDYNPCRSQWSGSRYSATYCAPVQRVTFYVRGPLASYLNGELYGELYERPM